MDPIEKPIEKEEPKEENKLRRHRTPTARQVKALQLINQGYSQTKALKEAGYSKHYANSSTQFMRQPVIQAILTGMKDELIHQGLTQKYMAGKVAKWMEAKKEDDDNYDVQLKGYDRWKEMMDYQGESKLNKGGIKRKLEITEFITGEDAQS